MTDTIEQGTERALEASSPSYDGPSAQRPGPSSEGKSYWRKNLNRLAGLLAIWFAGSYGTSILFVEQLDQFEFFGFRLGFWFAQQGSIYIFLALILLYIRMMNALDDEYVQERKDHAQAILEKKGHEG